MEGLKAGFCFDFVAEAPRFHFVPFERHSKVGQRCSGILQRTCMTQMGAFIRSRLVLTEIKERKGPAEPYDTGHEIMDWYLRFN